MASTYIVTVKDFVTTSIRNEQLFHSSVNFECTQAILDGRRCIQCAPGGCGPCQEGQVRVERDMGGKILDQVQCVQCDKGTVPDKGGTRQG